MARLSLTKGSLTKQKQLLKSFQEVLPSLDLKRRQLSAEQGKARQVLAETQQKLAAIAPEISQEIPMLSDESVNLADLVKVTGVELVEENVMGTRLPKVSNVKIQVSPYALLGKPFWIDRLVELLKTALEFQIAAKVANQRLALLHQAERTVTQRFNLFDKVLIPKTRANIKQIQIYLADAERAGVVNSKIAKRKKEIA